MSYFPDRRNLYRDYCEGKLTFELYLQRLEELKKKESEALEPKSNQEEGPVQDFLDE